MFGPTPKYRSTILDPIDGVPLYWQAHPDGYPVRQGDTPELIDKERLNHAGVQLFARTECFNIPEEKQKYAEVLDWIANTGAVLYDRQQQAVGDGKWVVWLTWFDVRGYIPKGRKLPGP